MASVLPEPAQAIICKFPPRYVIAAACSFVGWNVLLAILHHGGKAPSEMTELKPFSLTIHALSLENCESDPRKALSTLSTPRLEFLPTQHTGFSSTCRGLDLAEFLVA